MKSPRTFTIIGTVFAAAMSARRSTRSRPMTAGAADAGAERHHQIRRRHCAGRRHGVGPPPTAPTSSPRFFTDDSGNYYFPPLAAGPITRSGRRRSPFDTGPRRTSTFPPPSG